MAGTNMTFVKNLGVAFKIKSWREIFQRTVLRRVDLPVVRKVELSHIRCKEKCKSQPQDSDRSNFQSRIFKSLIYRTKNDICESRWKSFSISRSTRHPQLRKFGHFPILSLIGVTLGLDVSDLIVGKTEKMMSEMREVFDGYGWEAEPLVKLPQSLKDLDISTKSIAHGCEGAVFKAKVKTGDSEFPTMVPPSEADEEFDLALKAVFNYGAESNAQSILRELQRELLPLHTEKGQDCEPVQKYINRLPPHPNIVDMPGIFVDDMLVTEQGIRDFPAALPRRLDSERFFGRSKTLYLVMRRRSTHLRDYLQREDITMATRCLMLSQLLEGVSHLVDHGVAHRDLKTDNILVDHPKSGGDPRLEICDFGCCLAEEDRSLQVAFTSQDLFIGGNSWLMAPEISTKIAGPDSILDYRRSDLWAVGAIAYEILGAHNPFYPHGSNGQKLSSKSYREEELPHLPDDVPAPVKKLVFALLNRDPLQRPTPRGASAVMHMIVLGWNSDSIPHGVAAHGWVSLPGRKGRKPQVVFAGKERKMFQWVMVQSLVLLCQLGLGQHSDPTEVKAIMRFLFLSRLSYSHFRESVRFF